MSDMLTIPNDVTLHTVSLVDQERCAIDTGDGTMGLGEIGIYVEDEADAWIEIQEKVDTIIAETKSSTVLPNGHSYHLYFAHRFDPIVIPMGEDKYVAMVAIACVIRPV